MAARDTPPVSVSDSKAAWTELSAPIRHHGHAAKELANTDVVVNISITGETAASWPPPMLMFRPGGGLQSLPRNNWFRNLWTWKPARGLFHHAASRHTRTEAAGVQDHRVMRSVLLSHALRPAFANLVVAFAVALLIAAFLASFLPSLTLGLCSASAAISI